METVTHKTISDQVIEEVCGRLANNKPVRRSLPEWGRLHIDRQLPFLCIYRRIPENEDSLSERLIMGEASYLISTSGKKHHKQLALTVSRVAETLMKVFGSFLIVEVWLAVRENLNDETPLNQPVFTVFKPKTTAITSTVEKLQSALREIKIRKNSAKVSMVSAKKIGPPGLPSLLTLSEANKLGCHVIGIEIYPIHMSTTTGEVFPLIRRELQRSFSKALKTSFFEFSLIQTPHRPQHYLSLGRQSMVKAVGIADQQLAGICNGFDFLLQITPSNTHAAWTAFQKNRFEKTPDFIYRPLSLDPALAKRQLYQVPIERIEDPTLAQLFREQQMEQDRKLTMIIDRNTPRFLYGSLQLYGPVQPSLLVLANEILSQFPARSRDGTTGNYADAQEVAKRAYQELALFKKAYPDNATKVVIRDDITGMLVSHGNLLIGSRTRIPAARVEPLIQHEVGTHILTYLNGKAQPLQQFYIGLAGYEELQEGLAVLAEYLVGGLTAPRLRLLAVRVVATHLLIGGASFIEVFRILNKKYGFERRTAFNITVRTFRSGGLTKDAVYLRGLADLLEYLKKGGALDPLFIGKISASHIDMIHELQLRKVLHPVQLRPTYLDDPLVIERLTSLRNGLTLIHLIKKRKK